MPIPELVLKEISENRFKNSELDFGGEFGIGHDINDEDITELYEPLRKNTYITSIVLEGSHISDKSAILLSTINTLKQIDLSSTNVTSEGIKALLKSQITDLGLGKNGLTDDCLEGIQKNNTLKTIGLGGSRITLKGIKLISQNKSLEWIDLGSNYTIDDECAPYFASMKSLKILNLSNNLLTIKGAKILKESSIGEVGLSNNNFSKEDFLALSSEKSKYQPTSFPAFEASKKPKRKEEEVERKEESEEVAVKEVENTLKRPKSFHLKPNPSSERT